MGKTKGGPSVQVQQVEVTLSNDKGESQRENTSLRVKDLKKNNLLSIKPKQNFTCFHKHHSSIHR